MRIWPRLRSTKREVGPSPAACTGSGPAWFLFFLFKLRFQLIKETLEAPREIWAIFKMFIFLNGPVLWRHFWLRNLRSRQRVLNAGIFFCLDRADDMLRSQLADNISPLDVKQAAFSSSAPPQPPSPVPGNPCSFQERHSHLKG